MAIAEMPAAMRVRVSDPASESVINYGTVKAWQAMHPGVRANLV